MDVLAHLTDNQKEVLSFLKTRYHLYHLSNVFFRDIHYGVMAYLEWKGMPGGYAQTEKVAEALVEKYVHAGILKQVDRNAYVLIYPEFKKPPVKPAAPAKPAVAAAPKPAPGTAAAPKPSAPAASAASSSQGGE